MKKQSTKMLSFLFSLMALFLVACGGDMQKSGEGEDEASNGKAGTEELDDKMDVEKVLIAYYDLKNALVSSDAGTAMISANKLANSTSGEIQASAMAIKTSTDIVAQRLAFEKLSMQIYKAVKAKGGNKATVYKQFCPMAFDNKGAFWLSETSDIKNPYFGDEMLTCGNVQEELAAK